MSSQYEEDAIIRDFFGDKVGRFLDLGAADGASNSNTLALYERGWKGCLVEPNPFLFNELFKRYRLDDGITLVHAALSSDGRDMVFYHADQLSTSITDTVNLAHMKKHFRGKYWIRSFTPMRLAEIVGNDFDFVSLDCEAMDFEIASAAWSLFQKVKLLCFEHSLPGCRFDQGFVDRFLEMLAAYGFTRQIGKTHGNILVAR